MQQIRIIKNEINLKEKTKIMVTMYMYVQLNKLLKFALHQRHGKYAKYQFNNQEKEN